VTIRGLGVDVVDLERFAQVLERTPSFVERVFTEAERAYCEKAGDRVRVERYAGRFAAREAVMKALGVGLGAFAFHDVEVVRAEGGEPALAVRGKAAELAMARGITRWWITTSHSRITTVVVVVGE
jgi:holo-[acyl-carrier protein] synthase